MNISNFTQLNEQAGYIYKSYVSIEAQTVIPYHCIDRMLDWGCKTQTTIASRLTIFMLISSLIFLIWCLYDMIVNEDKKTKTTVFFILSFVNTVLTAYLIFF